jgi:hypothetical protein
MVVCTHPNFKLHGKLYPKSCHRCQRCSAQRFWDPMLGWSKWQLFMPDAGKALQAQPAQKGKAA